MALWEFCDRSAGYLLGTAGPGHTAENVDPVQEVLEIIRNLGGRTTLKAIRGKRRKFREAGVLEPIIEQAIDRGLLRRREPSSSGPGTPANCVELVELVAGQSGAVGGDAANLGIAVPVSVFAEDDCPNSDTGTTYTGSSENTQIHHAPPQAFDLDLIPVELEEANAREACLIENQPEEVMHEPAGI